MRYQIFFTQRGSSIITTCEAIIEIFAHLRVINSTSNLCSGELKNPESSQKFPKSHICKHPTAMCEQVYHVTRIQVSLWVMVACHPWVMAK